MLAPMKRFLDLFPLVHALMAVVFAMASLMLLVIAARIGWDAFGAGLDRGSAASIIEALGVLVVALAVEGLVAALQMLSKVW